MDFAKAIAEERTRILERLEAIYVSRNSLEAEESKLKIELKSIDAYINAKEGKPAAKKATRQPRTTGIKTTILEAMKTKPAGIKRAELIEIIGKDKGQSISNALVAMKKKGEVTADGGLYKVA